MTLLFDRKYSISVQEVTTLGSGSKAVVDVAPSFIPGLDPAPFVRCQFVVQKTIDSDPNIAIINLFGLKADTRAKFKKDDLLSFRVGYADDSDDPLFLPIGIKGNISRVKNTKEATGWKTQIRIGDGGFSFSRAKINEALPSDLEFEEVYKRIEKRILESGLEVATGFIDSIVQWLSTSFDNFLTNPNSTGTAKGGQNSLNSARTLLGPLQDIVTQEFDRIGLSWSVQDNVVYPRPKGGSDNRPAILISKDTGMIESPERNEKGGISGRTLIIPGLEPGRAAQVQSDVISGEYVATETIMIGDTDDQDWYIDYDASEPGASF